mmetsp:Transcript_32143/g.103794  ORF Transcript_32143/g.103794 Transcript_32143/m.103794 type:complete len:204 (+) Transcript_32143:342-953(+)|eukprot:scaffold1878_cov113-Isochrysis_galbana.AAC.11
MREERRRVHAHHVPDNLRVVPVGQHHERAEAQEDQRVEVAQREPGIVEQDLLPHETVGCRGGDVAGGGARLEQRVPGRDELGGALRGHPAGRVEAPHMKDGQRAAVHTRPVGDEERGEAEESDHLRLLEHCLALQRAPPPVGHPRLDPPGGGAAHPGRRPRDVSIGSGQEPEEPRVGVGIRLTARVNECLAQHLDRQLVLGQQ